jgi:hypothetical protein
MSTGSSLSTQSGLDAELAAVLAKGESIQPQSENAAAPQADTISDDLLDADWDEQYDSIQSLLEQLKAVSSRPLELFGSDNQRAAIRPTTSEHPAEAPESRINWVSWLVISSGLMLFVCGVILVAWSIVSGREELWRVGLPIALVGQATLVVGGALQLESLWVSNRHTNHAIERLDGELLRLQQSTRLRTPSRSAAAQSFYAHRAEHVSPHMMLADLKGQLDAIATRLSHREEPE